MLANGQRGLKVFLFYYSVPRQAWLPITKNTIHAGTCGEKSVKLLTYFMAKYWLPSVFAGLFIVLCGCGGSSSISSASGASVGGTSLSQYQATMPDGSVMELEILTNDDLNWSGEYAVSAQTGPYAFQDGTFDGTKNGDSVT